MTPGDIATKHPDESCRHPDESWGDFYTRREQGLTYEEYQEAARLPAPVQSAAAAPRGSTVTQFEVCYKFKKVTSQTGNHNKIQRKYIFNLKLRFKKNRKILR